MQPKIDSLGNLPVTVRERYSQAHAEAARKRPHVVHRTGVEPLKNGECPDEHLIKGNFTTYNGERCIYHMLGQRLYVRTKAERCYATEAEALQDGCRRSKV